MAAITSTHLADGASDSSLKTFGTEDTKTATAARAAMKTYSVYFAGGLFDLRQLHGNAALAAAIERISKGAFSIRLPQNIEIREFDPQQIRDDDFRAVMGSDLYLGQFDGTELDSGTVAEFMRAKQADIPALLLRTDFRSGGDQGQGKDPWNLMLSHFPRCETLYVDSMAAYKSELSKDRTPRASLEASQRAIDALAGQIIAKLGVLVASKPVLPRGIQEAVYRGIALTTGFKGGDDEAVAFALEALRQKQERGLLL